MNTSKWPRVILTEEERKAYELLLGFDAAKPYVNIEIPKECEEVNRVFEGLMQRCFEMQKNHLGK